MKNVKLLAPLVAVVFALAFSACASDDSPPDDPGVEDAPISSVDSPISSVGDGIDTEVEQGNNAGFEGDEDG